jgi:hypothetical protein
MTRYLCVDPSHRRHGDMLPVDVTAQVRSERAMLPRPAAYLAITEDVISAVADLGDASSRSSSHVARILSGVAEPQDLPVVLMSQHSVTRAPGHYELDDLRSTEPAIDRVAARVGTSHVMAGASDDLLIIDDDENGGPTLVEAGRQPTAVLTRPSQRTRIVPQGVYRLDELSARLAIADPTDEAMIDAIRTTPVYDARTVVLAEPWRVVITCPKPEGSPAMTHETLFTGMGAPEAAIAYGSPVDGWDLAVETSALADMAPAAEIARVEHRTWTLIATEAVVLAGLLALGWASGALRLAARETPGWLGLALVLAVAGISFGAIPLFAVRDPAANMNDTFVLRTLYESRLIMFRWAAAISAILFGLALMAGVIPPLSEGGRSVPAAAVTFDTSATPVTATMRVDATNIGAGHAVNVTMREYGAGDQVGTLVGDVTRNGNASGAVFMAETFALDPTARYISVLVTTNGRSAQSACNPSSTGTPGCTVLAVPPPTPAAPQTVTNVIIPPRATVPSLVPSPAPSL